MSNALVVPAPTHDTVQAKAARLVSPGYSWCGRCGLPWRFVEGHTTWYKRFPEERGRSGCFPLCESCWTILGTAEARLPYYAQWIEREPAVAAAVLAESTGTPRPDGGDDDE